VARLPEAQIRGLAIVVLALLAFAAARLWLVT
jgi:hypothetical protein